MLNHTLTNPVGVCPAFPPNLSHLLLSLPKVLESVQSRLVSHPHYSAPAVCSLRFAESCVAGFSAAPFLKFGNFDHVSCFVVLWGLCQTSPFTVILVEFIK